MKHISRSGTDVKEKPGSWPSLVISLTVVSGLGAHADAPKPTQHQLHNFFWTSEAKQIKTEPSRLRALEGPFSVSRIWFDFSLEF